MKAGAGATTGLGAVAGDGFVGAVAGFVAGFVVLAVGGGVGFDGGLISTLPLGVVGALAATGAVLFAGAVGADLAGAVLLTGAGAAGGRGLGIYGPCQIVLGPTFKTGPGPGMNCGLTAGSTTSGAIGIKSGLPRY